MTENAERFRLLYDLGCAFAARIDLDELVPLVISKCREVLDAEGASVLLLDAARDELYFPYVAEDDREVAARLLRLRFPADRGIAGEVIRTGHSLRVDDAASHPSFYGGVDRSTGFTTRAMLTVPLSSPQGVIGVIQVLNPRSGGSFTDDDLAFLEGLAGSVAVAIDNARLYAQVKASEERLRTEVGVLRRDIARRDAFTEIIGTSPAMAEVFRLMESAAASPITVLIEGETGTGKELVARGIHRASERAAQPFLAMNCAAVPETLLESQLFGHRRGSFTGALQDQRGLFEAATGGTIFLDEVGEMPPAMQAKLLRVIQEGEIVPLGDTRPRSVDVRLISATNRDLSAEVARGGFREDLYYRLAAFPILVPPLRERRDDIPLLVKHVLAGAAERHHKRIPGVDPLALELLVQYDWPGNVRQLQNEIERAVALTADGEVISVRSLSPRLRSAVGEAGAATLSPPGATVADAIGTSGSVEPLRQARAAFEASYIAAVLRRHGGNVSRSAVALGISRVMLQRKMKDYGLRDKGGGQVRSG